MIKKILSNDWVRQQIFSWGLYFAVGRRPNWRDKDQVRRFLIANEKFIIWVVKITRTNIDDKFALLYGQCINNRVVFDCVFDTATKIWDSPDGITTGLIIGKDEEIDKDNMNLRERIKARIQERKNKSSSVVEFEKAREPESIIAVITVISAFVNIAQLIIKFREYRRSKR